MSGDVIEPGESAVYLGPVAYEWTMPGHWLHAHRIGYDQPCQQDSAHLTVWHDCSQILGPGSVAPGEPFRWRAAGMTAHTVVQVEPLTVVASLYWPDCCGLHGFIADGKWVSA